MDKRSIHIIREIKQVNMLLKKIIVKNDQFHDTLDHKIKELEQTSITARKLIDKLPTESKNISPFLLEQIHNDVKTPLTPIKAYIQMLSSGQFGKLSDMQKDKISFVIQNIAELEDNVNEIR